MQDQPTTDDTAPPSVTVVTTPDTPDTEPRPTPATPATVAELYDDSPHMWCQGSFAKDAHGYDVDADKPTAVSFCLLGGILRVYGQDCGEDSAYRRAVRRLQIALARRLGFANPEDDHRAVEIVAWNDDGLRTFAEIKAIVTDAGI